MKAADTYERLVRPILFSLDPETAHHLAVRCLRAASRLPPALRVLRTFGAPARPKTLFGLNFPNPIGLAAGFDKNGVALPALAALGFGFIEIGTVTAKAQPGNPRPPQSKKRPTIISIPSGCSKSSPITSCST